MPPDREPVIEGQNNVPPAIRAKMDQAGAFILMLAAKTGQSLRATAEEFEATVRSEIAAKEKQA